MPVIHQQNHNLWGTPQTLVMGGLPIDKSHYGTVLVVGTTMAMDKPANQPSEPPAASPVVPNTSALLPASADAEDGAFTSSA